MSFRRYPPCCLLRLALLLQAQTFGQEKGGKATEESDHRAICTVTGLGEHCDPGDAAYTQVYA